ncbi:DUF2509 family protein [Atlantibacter hermannii]|uniref:DUF2509 family protein n=2 Tax=Atlantibacter hermannii TaxID=565 RepID=UPI0013EF5697|nr:DUF2509 family protein [Atlantibacter hermannii]MDQ7882867.1 DUF2509 family protein [Atlantibacter hermannii]
MNRQRGFSSVSMVMMLLILGAVLLHGLEQHLRTESSLLMNERRAMSAFNNALSAQAWGTTLDWQPTSEWQCKMRPENGWRACLKSISPGEVLMAAQGLQDKPPLTLWRWGKRGATVTFSSQGWIDICPLREATLCQLP